MSKLIRLGKNRGYSEHEEGMVNEGNNTRQRRSRREQQQLLRRCPFLRRDGLLVSVAFVAERRRPPDPSRTRTGRLFPVRRLSSFVERECAVPQRRLHPRRSQELRAARAPRRQQTRSPSPRRLDASASDDVPPAQNTEFVNSLKTKTRTSFYLKLISQKEKKAKTRRNHASWKRAVSIRLNAEVASLFCTVFASLARACAVARRIRVSSVRAVTGDVYLFRTRILLFWVNL